MEMEIDAPLPNSGFSLMNDAMFYDIIAAQAGFPICPYTKTDKDDLNTINNNISKSDSILELNQNINYDSPQMVNLNLMPPPPPHKMVSYSNDEKCDRRGNTRTQERLCYRPISPRDYDSDESCTSYSSRGTAPDSIGIKYSNSRNGINRLNEQTIMFGRYSRSFPNVCYSNNFHQQHNFQSPQNAQHYNHTNGNYNKNRCYQNSSAHNNNTTNNKKKHRAYFSGPASDVMIRRAHGLVERFKSRARLMRIDSNPAGLLTGGPWDQLNQAIWDVFSSKAQKEKTYESKINLWKNIFLYIRKCLNSYALYMVGSTMSGFGLETSDIDMCLLTKPCTSDPRLDSLHHLNNIRHALMTHGLTVDPELILAKVPILKFRDEETGFEIDLNCNNAVGIRNTHLLHCYAQLDWRVRPLVIMVKLWAQANNINDAKNMTVSSYSWALMVINYLQCGVSPPVLPCLHGLVPDHFNSDSEHHSTDVQEDIASIKDFKSDNTLCLAELLLGFFHYYSVFNYNQFSVSVRSGCRIPVEECRNMKAPKNDPHQWKYLCIEEPFDFTNTARSVYDLAAFKHIKNVMTCSYHELAMSKMLNNILPVNLSPNQR